MAIGEIHTELLPLLGRDDPALDSKNRILLAKKMRDRLGPNFALWVAEKGCIVAQPGRVWDELVAEIFSKDQTNQGCDLLRDLIFPTSDDCLNCDEQGRIVIAEELRIAGRLCDAHGNRICERLIVLGCGDRIEIWSPSEYEFYCRDKVTYGGPRRAEFERAREMMRGTPVKAHPVEEAIRRMGRG